MAIKCPIDNAEMRMTKEGLFYEYWECDCGMKAKYWREPENEK